MALKRSAGIGAITLCVALATCNEALGYGNEGKAVVDIDGKDGVGHTVSRGSDRAATVTVVARRGFGKTGRQTAKSSGE